MAKKGLFSEINDLQTGFWEHLLSQGMSESTAATKRSDAFYLLRHDNTIDFLDLLYSDDFEKLAREHLQAALQARSAAKGANIGTYMSAIRALREYASETEKTLDPDLAQANAAQGKQNKASKAPIPRPSPSEADRYLRIWNTTADLCQPERVLKQLFTETHPENNSLDGIMLKVAALNTVYNTHIYSVYPVARHILSLDIDERLRSGDEMLVHELMRVVYDDGKRKGHYSFATKYCSFHNPDAFPIYDSYVDKIMQHYRDTERFASFKNMELKDYPTFKSILAAFTAHFGLERFSAKQIDHFLWLFGKTYFK